MREQNPNSQIHFLTRADFAGFLSEISGLHQVHAFERREGLAGLIRLAFSLRELNFDLVYDAHNNQRSKIISFLVSVFKSTRVIRRSKRRWKRFLLFKFRHNLFPKPFRGGISYLEPLGLNPSQVRGMLKRSPTLSVSPYVALAPHATWALKELPTAFWLDFVAQNPTVKFIALGGPDDEIPEQLAREFPQQVTNRAGKTSWAESAHIIANAREVVGVDTGLTHLADYFGVPAHFLIGPSAFGYPTRSSSGVVEEELYCKPCTKDGRGRCVNKVHKKCLVDLKPGQINIGDHP